MINQSDAWVTVRYEVYRCYNGRPVGWKEVFDSEVGAFACVEEYLKTDPEYTYRVFKIMKWEDLS